MRLINLDGLTLIGPGSEWFWTALSGLVLAATFVALFRQLRLQAHTGAIAQIDAFMRDASSETMDRHVLPILVALRDGTALAEIPEADADFLGSFWEKIGTLARAGHMDLRLLAEWVPHAPQVAWLVLGPYTQMSRARSGDPRSNANLEWLAGVMSQADRRAGVEPVTMEWVSSALDRWIENLRSNIRIHETLRATPVRRA